MNKRRIRKWAYRPYRVGAEPTPRRWWHWIVEIALTPVLLYIVLKLFGVIRYCGLLLRVVETRKMKSG